MIAALQRNAGNQSVARYIASRNDANANGRTLARDPPGGSAGAGTPAPAAGASPPPAPAPGSAPAKGQAGGDDGDVVLPQADADFAFALTSSERRLPLDLPDLAEFEIGKGSLSTDSIPLGDSGVSAKLDIGAEDGLTLRDSALVLTPVTAVISASRVKDEHEDMNRHRGAATTAGMIGAAVGGIAGGLMTPIWAGGPLEGAKQGGALAGRLAERAMMPLRTVRVQLTKGAIQGQFGLRYRPYAKLTLSGTGASWLGTASISLQTALGLRVIPELGFAGQEIELLFRGGQLEHTRFTLRAPSPKLSLIFDAFGVVDTEARLLPFLDGSWRGRDDLKEHPGMQVWHERSAPFPIVQALEVALLGGDGTQDAEKGSATTLGKKHIAPKTGGVATSFAKTLLPHITDHWPWSKSKKFDEDEVHSGRSESDAIPMRWYKPIDWYPKTIVRKRPGKSDQEINAFPHKHYADGDFDMGVDGEFWPWEGKKMVRRSEVRGQEVAWYKHELETLGIDLDSQLHYNAQIDHVQDLAWQGPDDSRNLWPYYDKANMRAGWEQNLLQPVYWADKPGEPPRQTPIMEVPRGRWFVIMEIKEPTGIKSAK